MLWFYTKFCALLCITNLVFSSAEENFFISIPQTLFVEHENIIQLKSFDIVTRVEFKLSLEANESFVLDQFVHPLKHTGKLPHEVDIAYKPSVMSLDRHPINIRVNVSITIYNHSDPMKTYEVTRQERVRLVRRVPLLIGEVEKPIYRPGETVRFRFLALPPQLTVPLQHSPNYPKRKLVHQSGRSYTIEQISDQEWARLNHIQFNEISVSDPRANRVKKWLNVSPYTAATLNFTLLPDATEGEWSVTATAAGETETISFTVKHYVLPRFVIDIKPPVDLTFNSNHTEFSVCAKYTNGPAMFGFVRAILCVCDKGYDNSVQKTEAYSMLENRICVGRYPSAYRRPCVEARGPLENNGCARFNVSTAALHLNSPRSHYWNQASMVCAEVIEDGTGSNVTKCEEGKNVERVQSRLEINFPEVYRTGLPLSGTIEFVNLDPSFFGRAHVRITVTEQKQFCWPIYGRRIPSEGTFLYGAKRLIEESGPMEVFIPPINSTNRLAVKATIEMNDDKGEVQAVDGSSSSRNFDKSTHSYSAYHSIEPFVSNSKIVMQRWPTHEPLTVECPGRVSIKLLANTPLADKTIHIQSVVRGRLLKRTIPPSVDSGSRCVSQDGPLGHYKCLDDGGIECLPGWMGFDCSRPICSVNCHPTGGTCNVPYTCVCKDGWTGNQCEQCVIRPGCVHGKCVEGNDCVCDPGWTGYRCDRTEVIHERVPLENPENVEDVNRPAPPAAPTQHDLSVKDNASDWDKDKISEPRRTLFEREISFDVDENWGPQATVVIYFYDESGNDTEIVPVTVELDNMQNCTNPVSVLHQQSEENGIHFDAYKVCPGQPLKMSLNLVGLNESLHDDVETSTLSDQTCFVRISDESLTNFESGKSVLDLQQYATMVHDLDQKGIIWRPKSPLDVKQAFQAAGLHILVKYVTERVHIACSPMLYAEDAGPVPMPLSSPHMRAMSVPSGPIDDHADGGNMAIPKPRLRDFFPEVWLFDVSPMQLLDNGDGKVSYGVQKSLTTPDTLTSWQASAFCTTRSHGLWIPPMKKLTVSMPFFLEMTLPKQVKRGEILYLPVSLFVFPEDEATGDIGCLEVHATTKVDDNDWLRIGATSFSGCVCPGQKQTFQLGLLPKRLGQLNVTAEAYAIAGGSLCNDEDSITRRNLSLSDMLRRQIRVVPEGVPKEHTAGTMLCIEPNQTFVTREFHMSPVENMYSGSLRLYASYSDEVLGPALKNLNNLVRLPVGCGEQNMLLVAPNVYVLDYLLSTTTVNPEETQKLMRTAKSHIVSGYVQQLKYRHEDGSYSAFGKSDGKGSTWLTAFVLRVFSKAFQVDPNPSIDWSRMLNESAAFLVTKVDSDGCFLEEGRVIHAAMQGGLGSSSEKKKTMLLASYVLVALHELNKAKLASHTYWANVQTRGLACLEQSVKKYVDNSRMLVELDTYALAQISYALTLLDPASSGTRVLQEELIKRRNTELSQSGAMSWWTAGKDASSDTLVTSADIETTAYAYLSLTQMNPPMIDPFPVVRWLSSQQKSTGGFQSTQDTVLALQVISDGAKRLNLGADVESDNVLDIAVQSIPAGEVIVGSLTDEKRRVVNQFSVPFTIEQAVRGFWWNLSRPRSGARECVAIQNTLHYNVPESTAIENGAFWISHNVAQKADDEDCSLVNLTICIRPGTSESLHRDSGMLLAQVHMVSGWNVLHDSVLHLLGNETDSLRQVEFDDKGTASLYFDGFSTQEAKMEGGWDNLKRCSRLQLKQKAYVENAASASIFVRDYYDSERLIETSYSLDACKSHWGIEEPSRPELNPSTTEPVSQAPTTGKTLTCPKCFIDAVQNRNLSEFIFDALCNSHSNLYLLNVSGTDTGPYAVKVTTISSGNYTASWNATLNRTSLQACPCESITNQARLIFISSEPMLINAGDPVVVISRVPPDTLLLPVSDVLSSIEQAKSRWLRESEVKTDSPKQWGCRRIPVLYRYIIHKFLNT